MLKLALVGCGGFAEKHLNELIKRSEVEVAFFIDPLEERRKLLMGIYRQARGLEAEGFASLEKLLASRKSFDAAIIITPPSTHFEIAKILIEEHKSVYVEKPFTSTSLQAQELVCLADKNKVEITIGANRCVFPSYRMGANLYRQGAIGGLVGITMYYRHNWEGNTKGNWRQNPNHPDSGILSDHSTHYTHYLCTDLGFKPASVDHIGTRYNELGVDVDLIFSLKDKLGRSAFLVFDGSPGDNNRKEVTKIYGTKGIIKIQFENNLSKTYIIKNGKEDEVDLELAIKEIEDLGIRDSKSHPALIHNFVSLLTGQCNVNANPGKEGIAPVSLIELAKEKRGFSKESTLSKKVLSQTVELIEENNFKNVTAIIGKQFSIT